MNNEIKTEEYMSVKKKRNFLPFLIVLVVIVLLGVGGYFIYHIIDTNNKKQAEIEKQRDMVTEETMSISSPKIVTLYNYVKYERANSNNINYFLSNKKITIDNFDNARKIVYSTQFLTTDDFLDTGRVENNLKVYSVSIDLFEKAMSKFFGSVISYDKAGNYGAVLPFAKDGGNKVNLVYDDSIKSFVSTFSPSTPDNSPIKSYYTKLISAKKKTKGDNGTIKLKEKVIYVGTVANGDNTIINIYSDYTKTKLIDSLNVANASINADTVKIDNYISKANTVTYTFKGIKNKYYFYSSEIKN